MPIEKIQCKYLIHWVGFREGKEYNYSNIETVENELPTETDVVNWEEKLTKKHPDQKPIFIIGFYRLHE